MAALPTLDRYGFRQQREPERKTKPAAPVHADTDAESESTWDGDIQVLKAFDLDYTYGPAIGVTRLERWERAKGFGLNPPLRVKELLDKHPNSQRYTECLWDDSILSDHSTVAE